MPRETTGRCHRCKIRFIWEGKPRLKDAFCPDCGSKLQQTTHLWKGRSDRRQPMARKGKIEKGVSGE
jgi:rRNA maturation endonuclease Nob1